MRSYYHFTDFFRVGIERICEMASIGSTRQSYMKEAGLCVGAQNCEMDQFMSPTLQTSGRFAYIIGAIQTHLTCNSDASIRLQSLINLSRIAEAHIRRMHREV